MKALNDAALARLRAVWHPAQVHETNKVPATPLTPYVAMSVSAGGANNYNLAAQHGSRPNRIVIRVVGKSLNEISAGVEASDIAFLDYALTAPGWECSPALNPIAIDPLRDPDAGGLLVCTLVYTFTAYPTGEAA